MTRARFTHNDAMTLWRARDIYRVQAVCKGLVLLFFVVEFFGYCALGYWWLGLVVIPLPVGLLWCLRWGLRGSAGGPTRCGVSITQIAVQTWRRAHRSVTHAAWTDLAHLDLRWHGEYRAVHRHGLSAYAHQSGGRRATQDGRLSLTRSVRTLPQTMQQLHQQAVPSPPSQRLPCAKS